MKISIDPRIITAGELVSMQVKTLWDEKIDSIQSMVNNRSGGKCAISFTVGIDFTQTPAHLVTKISFNPDKVSDSREESLYGPDEKPLPGILDEANAEQRTIETNRLAEKLNGNGNGNGNGEMSEAEKEVEETDDPEALAEIVNDKPRKGRKKAKVFDA